MVWSDGVAGLRLSALALCLSAVSAGAVTVGPCDELASVRSIAEPWEASTRTFANGDIRLVVLDTIEPAAAAFHLVILHPPRDEVGGQMCTQVSASDGLGFGGMDIGPAAATYDPARGLTVTLPISFYDAEAADYFVVRRLSVTINQATGLVTAAVR